MTTRTPPPARPRSSFLDRVKQGDPSLPPRIVLYADEGMGKTTFAAQAPDPLFFCSEDGLGVDLAHVPRIEVEKFDDVMMNIDDMIENAGHYKTVVLDTADWLERLVHEELMKSAGVDTIEKVGGGYGKGYKASEERLNTLLAKLDMLRMRQRVMPIILAHTNVRPFANPIGDDHDLYELKCHKGFAGLLREWPDCLLFAGYEVFSSKDDRKKNGSKVVGGERLLFTGKHPAYRAKNRANLPEVLPFEKDTAFQAFWEAYEKGTAAAKEGNAVSNEVLALFQQAETTLGEEVVKKWNGYLSCRTGKVTLGTLARIPVPKLIDSRDTLKAQLEKASETKSAPKEAAAAK